MSVMIDGHNEGLKQAAKKLEAFIREEMMEIKHIEVSAVLQRLEKVRLELVEESKKD